MRAIAKIISIAKTLAFADLGRKYPKGRYRKVMVATNFAALAGLKVGDFIECDLEPNEAVRHIAFFGRNPRIVAPPPPKEGHGRAKQPRGYAEEKWVLVMRDGQGVWTKERQADATTN